MIAVYTSKVKPDTPPTYRFYMDDSGSRDPDRRRTTDANLVDWFALGGVIVREEDLPFIEARVKEFRLGWPHPDAPLHSWEIRARKDGFAWLRNVSKSKYERFQSRPRKSEHGLKWNGCSVGRG